MGIVSDISRRPRLIETSLFSSAYGLPARSSAVMSEPYKKECEVGASVGIRLHDFAFSLLVISGNGLCLLGIHFYYF